MLEYDEALSGQMMLQISVRLRKVQREDLPKLEWAGQYTHFRNLYRRAFREQQQGRRILLLADCNGYPIGQIFIQLKGHNTSMADGANRAYLYAFRVMDPFRGQGIGTWMIREAEGVLVRKGIATATIAAGKDNPRARQLYERLGYRLFGEDPGRWSYLDHHGEIRRVEEPCWLLEKSLVVG